jgi:hypothetical protein
MSEESEIKSAEIIKGPWKGSKRKVKLPNTDAIKLQETINFIDDLTQTLIIQMIHTIEENDIDVDSESFVQSMTFIIEMVRASLLKEMSLNTNMTKILDVMFEMLFNSSPDSDSEVSVQLEGDVKLIKYVDDLKLIITKMRMEEDDDVDPELA